MDPNAALEQIRESAKTILADELPDADYPHAANRLADLVDGLDQWLTKGGFAPTEWQSPDTTIVTRLRELPWGEDEDINGGDLVQLVGNLLQDAGYVEVSRETPECLT